MLYYYGELDKASKFCTRSDWRLQLGLTDFFVPTRHEACIINAFKRRNLKVFIMFKIHDPKYGTNSIMFSVISLPLRFSTLIYKIKGQGILIHDQEKYAQLGLTLMKLAKRDARTYLYLSWLIPAVVCKIKYEKLRIRQRLVSEACQYLLNPEHEDLFATLHPEQKSMVRAGCFYNFNSDNGSPNRVSPPDNRPLATRSQRLFLSHSD